MKTHFIFLIGTVLSTQPLTAQLLSGSQPAALPTPTADYSITERGSYYRRWEKLVSETDPSGRNVPVTHSYVELGAGICYVDPQTGQWADSQERVVGFPGGAISREGPIQMIFPNDISAEPIDAQTDAGRFRSAVVCLSYADYTLKTNLIIAEIQPCQGQIVAPNQVLYPKAFSDGVSASVIYTYHPYGWSQDVLIEDPGTLPAPEALGLDSSSPTLVLQVTTEFLDAPPPAQTSRTVLTDEGLALEDEEVDWGAIRLAQGQALFLGPSANSAPVNTVKRWTVTPDNRRFLTEEVPFGPLLREFLSRGGGGGLKVGQTPRLTPPESVAPGKAGEMHALFSMAPTRGNQPWGLPKLKPARANPKPMELAAGPMPERGLFIDYQTLSGSVTNLTLQSDLTYFVTGPVSLAGTTVCEGSVVIKFTNSPTAKLSLSGPLQCNGAQFSPIVMTSMNDDTCGEVLPSSTHNPTNYNGATYLEDNNNQNNTYRYLRVLYAATGLSAASFSNGVWHCQFVKCGTAINATGAGPVALRNVLITQCTNAVLTPGTLRAEHLTADQCATLLSGAGSSGCVTNSLITAVNTLGNVSLYNSPQFASGAGVYQTVGASSYYLADGSTNRNAGLTNINPTLAHDLALRTTYPPIVWSNVVISSATTLWPQAQRDTDLPDLGFHADPLDLCLNSVVVTNCTLLLTNGVAIGTYGATGIRLYGQLVSRGLANNLNRIVRYNTVQEQSTSDWALTNGTTYCLSYAGTSSSVQCGFTAWSLLASSSGYHVSCTTTYNPLSWFAHNQFSGGRFNAYPMYVSFTNCLWERVYVNFQNQFYTGSCLYNNLFRGGTLSCSIQATNGPSIARDNLFDQTSITPSGTYNFVSGYNAYVTNWTRIQGSSGNDVILTNRPIYLSGYLGNYYYPTNDGMLSRLINAGSTSAGARGLYHFTTTTNQAKEGGTMLDIGLHWVAIDPSSGLPYDHDGDGLPDYIEDTNGDGAYGAGDFSDWTTYNSLNGLAGSSGLRVFTPLK